MPSSRRHGVVTATGAHHKVQETKTEQAAEIIAFADYWNNATGSDPGLLVFDSQLTTCRSSTSSPAAASTGSPCSRSRAVIRHRGGSCGTHSVNVLPKALMVAARVDCVS
jgi:hypothetical protein